MFFKALILALACAGAYASLRAAADDSDCALYLTGPGRSSAYDYSINLLKGNFGYDGQQTCITYDAINQAYLEARQRILVAQPKGDWKPEDYASVGELVLDVSINIARRYGLTYEEIEKGLPLIDTSRTLIREVCPPVFSHVECRAGKYRRLDGLCNNLRHPTWGAINAPFQRLLSPLFSDGINAPRIAHSGRDLPLSRVVSRTMHPDDGFHDHAGTVMVIAWGQFMDHDYTLTGTPLDPLNRNDPEECCKRPPHLKHPYCNEIRIPDDDYFYRLFGVKCIDFVRGFPSPRPGCRLGSRTPFNTLTGSIDGNTVYGVTEKFARKLRTGYGGLLRMNPVFKEYGLKDLLPLKLDIPDEGCTRPNKNMYCFEAGEIRVNEQLVLTVMHTLMAREHNRVAGGLAAVNPHWDDETLYQEARRINIAEIQHITYNEFLPILLGKDVMEKFGLVLEKEGFWDGYDEEVNPDVLASFAAAAYRFGHSLLPTAVERWSKAHKFIASKRLSDLIRRPYDLYRAGVLDEYVMGLMNQVAQAMDDSITQEVTNHLFKKVGARFGMDLVSFNMQRGREFGLPGYMEFRKFCGLPGAETFQDLFGSMSNETVRKYETIFEHPVDVDLWSGGVSERPLPGSMLGPTFACIIATQFSYSRRGDRFWFELPNQPSSFTPEQLGEIRKARLARVICDNTDIIDTVQLYPFVLPDHELNPRVPCRSGILPSMDFSKWAEPAPFHTANAKGFITEAFVSRNDTDAENETKRNMTSNDLQKNIYCNCSNNLALNQSQCSTNSTQCSDLANKNTGIVKLNATENESTDKNNKVMEYMYNKNDNSDTGKTIGHYKNSLRKKRSTDSQNDQTAPLIVNYETSHVPAPVREREQWLPAKNTANIIPNSNLANFNIETIHENVGGSKPENDEVRSNDNDVNKETISEHSESKNRDNNDHIIDSKEEKEELQDSKNQEDDNSSESESHGSDETSNENNSHSNANGQNYDRSSDAEKYEERDENGHKHNSRKNTNEEIYDKSIEPEHNESSSKNNRNNSDEQNDDISDEAQIYKKHDENDTYNNSKFTQFKSDSEERVPRNQHIQHVDLNDFGYEKIQLNKKGQVESVKDTKEGEENIPMNKSNTKTHDKSNYLANESSDSSSFEANEPTHINDGEVKPVVEINAEVDSFESNEGNPNSKIENESLETLTGVNEDLHEKSDKIKEGKGTVGDVKQQFERIPINYEHKEKAYTDKKDQEDDRHFENKDDEREVGDPKGVQYDENLNIKFGDLNIKLPEIKLPDDVLSYSAEDSGQHKENKKPKHFYNYKSVEEEEETEEPNDADENDYYGYRDHSKKPQSYKKHDHDSEEKDNDEDPYEKFVRERFGKRGNFRERSQKLQDLGTHNPQLYKTVQNVLEKTKQLNKEAVKSGDPNAGYMWTLEYGEKL